MPSSSVAGEAMRSAWLAVTMQAVPDEAPMPTAPRSSSTTSCPSRASAYAAEAPMAPAPITTISVAEGRDVIHSTMLSARTPSTMSCRPSRHGGIEECSSRASTRRW